MDTVKIIPRTNFKSIRKIEPIYTGGKVIVSPDSKLITASGEDVYVTCLNTGAMIHKLQGVRVICYAI